MPFNNFSKNITIMSDESESEQSEAGEEPEVEEFNEHKLSD